MKTAISIPLDVFKRAEQLARRSKKSRSEWFSDAVREYVSRHATDDMTEAMDRVCDAVAGEQDKFTSSAARRVLARSKG
jgi:metal-responsive CopG/Arc/MetJ family transcriptional regulator